MAASTLTMSASGATPLLVRAASASDALGRFRNAPDALRHPADGVAVEREVDQGVHERRNLIKGEMHGKRRDRLSQGRGEPFRPEPQEDVRRGQAPCPAGQT